MLYEESARQSDSGSSLDINRIDWQYKAYILRLLSGFPVFESRIKHKGVIQCFLTLDQWLIERQGVY